MLRLAILLLVCLSLLSISSFVAADAGGFVTVNGTSVSQDEFCRRLEGVNVEIVKNGQRVTLQAGEYIMRQYIQEMLITQLAAKEQVTPTPEQVQMKVDYAKWKSRGVFEEELKNQGLTEDQWREQLGLQQCLTNLLVKGITVTDADAKAEYDKQMKSDAPAFKKPEARNFSVIACADKAKADSAYKRLQAGEDFGKLAKALSEDKSTASDGGKVGWLSADMVEAPELVRLTVFGTAVGKYSKPVFLQDKNNKAWVIVLVTEKREEQIDPFDVVKNLVKEQIAVKKADQKALDKKLHDFVAESKIDVSAARYKGLIEGWKKDAAKNADLAQPAVGTGVGK